MNRRLGIPQRPTIAKSEKPTPLGFDTEGDEATAVHFGFEEITAVGTLPADRDPIVVGSGAADGDEPTAEYPRRRAARRDGAPLEWYVRLRLTENRIAKLWVRRLAPLDVLVWWEAEQIWAPPLSVPEMRVAIAAARAEDAERARVRAELPPPPLPARTVTSEERLGVGLQETSWVEEWRQRVAAESRMTPAVRALISGARRRGDPGSVLRPQEIRPPPSSLPPMVVDVEPPRIPAAPRVPDIAVPRLLAANSATSPLTGPDPAAPGQLATPARSGLGNTERMVWFAAAAVLSFVAILSHIMTRQVQQASPASPAVVSVAATVPSEAPKPVGPQASASVAVSAAASPPAPARAATPRRAARVPVRDSSGLPGRSARPALSPSASSETVPSTPGASAPVPTSAGPAVAARPTRPDPGGFDSAAARRALVSAAQRVRYCGEGTISGAVVVTFSTSGFVQRASLANLQGDNVRPDCVLRSFQAVRITPYDGQPVTVSKSFRAR